MLHIAVCKKPLYQRPPSARMYEAICSLMFGELLDILISVYISFVIGILASEYGHLVLQIPGTFPIWVIQSGFRLVQPFAFSRLKVRRSANGSSH